MCTVSINIDEETIQQIDPNLTTQVSISRWLQHQVNLMLKEMTIANMEKKQALDRDMTPEQLYSLIAKEIDEIYANG